MTAINDRSQVPATSVTTWKIDQEASRVEFTARMCKTRRAPVPKRAAQFSFFVMITSGGHDDNVFSHRMRRNIWNSEWGAQSVGSERDHPHAWVSF